MEAMERRLVLSGVLVTGSGKGSPAEVTVYDSGTGAELFQFAPYGSSFRGGVQVAVGDVNGDGSLDIVTAPGPGMPGLVKVYSSTNGAELGQFLARPKSYQGGLTVAAGDVQGNGSADIVVGNQSGPAMVGVFQGVNGQAAGAFRPAVGGGSGVQVAVGDLNLDGHDDIVTAPITGRPWITVYDGASGQVLSHRLAFSGAPRGGVAIAVGDVNGDRQPDLITAEANRQGATVRVYSGLSAAPMLTDSVTGAQFVHGVRVAAIDIGAGLGGDGVALAPASGGGSAATVFDFSAVRTSLFGGLPTAAILAQAPTVAYQLPRISGGDFVAASNAVSESTSAFVADTAQASAPLQPIQRLARFQYDPVTGAPEFVPVVANDPNLVGKDVIVLVHGWAADYSYWVNDVAANTNPKLPTTLTWWDTDPSQPAYNLAANLSANQQAGTILSPASNFLLHGYNNLGIEAADTGMAQTIAARVMATDPKAVVLAYTWIDDSATSSITNPYLAEAKTVENGERLADALRTALGSQAAFGGEIQLIGHSFGSKVATVAAVSLTTKDLPNTFDVRQLTILDSPEDLSETTNALWANNFNWYYLQSLNISKTNPEATFVDNYISYLDEPYSNIVTPSGNSLSQVVDVNLDSSPFPITDRHSYSAYWYTGSGESDLTNGQQVGQMWSPLIPGNQGPSKPPANLASYYTQTWASSSYDPKQQFVLQPGTLASRPYMTSALAFNRQTNTPAVMSSNSSPTGTGASVTLTETSNITMPSFTGPFTTPSGQLNGVSFNYSFPANAPEATLTVTMDGYVVFVIDSGSVAVNSTTDGTRAGVGTLTLSQSSFSSPTNHTLGITLTPGAGVTTAKASITNLNFFYT
jgi:pimeloyl-ACP methyl ester carboxylesterase